MAEHWGGPLVIADGRQFDARALPGLIVGERQGVALYEAAGARAELVLLHALTPGRGLGTALVEALAGLLAPQGVRELWLTTTNDNLDALRFYQRRGFLLMELRAGAIAEVRKLKPTIPRIRGLRNFGPGRVAAGAAVEFGWGPRSCEA